MSTQKPGFLPIPKSIDKSIGLIAREKIDNKTKPLGSLGSLEDIAVKLSTIQGNTKPAINNALILTFASDHGLAEEGVSAFPKEVSAQMVDNFVSGGAAINVICKHLGIDLFIVDMGVDSELDKKVIDKKVRKSTRNCAKFEAMTEAELELALKGGMEAFFEIHEKKPVDMLGLGEMGIANSSSAVLLIASMSKIDIAKFPDMVGRGTGLNDKGLLHKRNVLQRVYKLHNLDKASALEAMCRVGGYEIAGMAGAAIAAASLGVPIMLDGLISTAAGLFAYSLIPEIKDYMFIAHKSVEKAQAYAAKTVGLEPILDLGMRLGEGTGAALAINLAAVACSIMRDMASFEEASISRGDLS